MNLVYAVKTAFLYIKYARKKNKKNTQKSSIPLITVKEVQNKLKKGNFVVLDVRSPKDYKKAHFRTSVRMDSTEIFEELTLGNLERIEEIKKSYQEIGVLCYGGGYSEFVVELLAELNVPNVYNIDGGISKWKKIDQSLITKA